MTIIEAKLWSFASASKGFLCLVFFPKSYALDKDELVNLWMTEGLIKPERLCENKQLEDISGKLF